MPDRQQLRALFVTINPHCLGTSVFLLQQQIERRRWKQTWRRGTNGGLKLEKQLVQSLNLSCITTGAHLNPQQHIEVLLHLVARDEMLHFHCLVVSMCLFFNAKTAHRGRKSQLISVSMPEACQPHQLPVQLPLYKDLDSDHHAVTATHLRRFESVDALHWVQTQSCTGHQIRTVWSQRSGTPLDLGY